MKLYSRILGTGSYLPKKILTNKDIEDIVDTTDEWIFDRTGIHQRHVVTEGETCSDLAVIAANAAMEAAGVAPSEIDLIVLATTTPDQIFPSTACIIQPRLGIKGVPAFDIQAVCAGFVYALSVADNFIRTGSAKRALVIGADTMSRLLDWQDRSTCILFADGAGAVVLGAAEEPGIISTHISADGAYKDLLQVPKGIGRGGCEDPYLEMRGNEVFRWAVSTLGRIVEETLEANGMDKSEIDWLVPHQANIRIIQATARRLNLPMEQVVVTVADHGNTSAASIPLALDTAVRDGRIQRGQTILMEGFGGGFTWGSVLARF
ncbi:MAG: beta-ketoacyl-ACP synthase III [Chromatiaceae bacterium]